MAKISVADIAGMGFTKEMFGKESDGDFAGMIDNIIAEQSDLLKLRVSGLKYDSDDPGIKLQVTRAEKCLAGAEMIQARIIYTAGNAVPNGEEPDTGSLDRQRDKYAREANELVAKIITGALSDSSDFATGATVSAGTTRAVFLSAYK
jgi:hypothetical protein